MAVRDVREYYYKLLAQKEEMVADLADFDEALKNGYITEEQVQAAKEELIPYETNLDRVAYIMYLLELPSRKSKQPKHNKQNKKLLDEFKARNADEESILAENKSALDKFRAELKKLKEVK